MDLTAALIVPTLNRQHDLIETLRSWMGQTRPFDEVVVVEAGDLEATQHSLAEAGLAGSVRLIGSSPGLPRQRNVGVEHTRADVVFFSDDDLTADPRNAEVLLAHFSRDEDRSIGAAGGYVHDQGRPPRLLGHCTRKLFRLTRMSTRGCMQRSGFPVFALMRQEGVVEVGVLSGTLAVRREVFREFKFDERLEGYALMEDSDFSSRVGRRYRMVYDPAARSVHRVSPIGRKSLRDFCAMLVVNYHYLFRKNRAAGAYSWPAFWWANLGLVLYWGLIIGVQRRSWMPLRGLARGFSMALRGKLWPATANARASASATSASSQPRGA